MKDEIKKSLSWAFPLAVITFVLAAVFSVISTAVLGGGILASIAVILVILLVALFFDIIGVAATAASEVPFHSMSSKKVGGARYAVWIAKKADRVNTFCTDVIGDIASILTGTAAVTFVAEILPFLSTGGTVEFLISVLVTSLVSALTIFVKALGKSFAIKNATKIIHKVGYLFYFTEVHLHIPVLRILESRSKKAGKEKGTKG